MNTEIAAQRAEYSRELKRIDAALKQNGYQQSHTHNTLFNFARITKYLSLLVAITEAENSKAVEQLLETYALPAGSSRVKKVSVFNLAVNSYVGGFFGRSGQALLKSLERLAVDPLAVYGTNCLKFGTEPEKDARGWLTRELHIVQPKLLVAMGDDTVAFVNSLEFPLSDELEADRHGELQPFTPTIEALVTPDIDASLDEQGAKTRFWNAFKTLGAWWAELPPY